jgi:spore germination protein KC
MKYKPVMLLLMLLLPFLLSGCWDRNELQKLNIVSAIGIDKGSDNVNNRYRITVQIINTTQVSGGQQSGKVQAAPVTSYTAFGSTLSEATMKISGKASGELFFPHVQLLVIGEDMAKEGIKNLFDVIERESKFRILFPVLIVKGNKAENLLKVTTPLEAIPSANIVSTLETSKNVWGVVPVIRADQVISGLGKGSIGITGVQIKGNIKTGNKGDNIQQIYPDARIEINGLAIFKEGKLKNWLEQDAARGVTWAKKEVKGTVINLDCKNIPKGIAIDIKRSKSAIKVKIKNNKPVISLATVVEGNVSETHCPISLDNNKELEILEAQMEKEIKAELMKAVMISKKQKSDLLGFGEYVNIEDKRLWKQIKNKWEDEILPETEVNVTVHAFIRRTGLRMKSYIQ